MTIEERKAKQVQQREQAKSWNAEAWLRHHVSWMQAFAQTMKLEHHMQNFTKKQREWHEKKMRMPAV